MTTPKTLASSTDQFYWETFQPAWKRDGRTVYQLHTFVDPQGRREEANHFSTTVHGAHASEPELTRIANLMQYAPELLEEVEKLLWFCKLHLGEPTIHSDSDWQAIASNAQELIRRASTEGGMKTGEIPSEVTLRFEAASITITCDAERSQHANRSLALVGLKAMLEDKK